MTLDQLGVALLVGVVTVLWFRVKYLEARLMYLQGQQDACNAITFASNQEVQHLSMTSHQARGVMAGLSCRISTLEYSRDIMRHSEASNN